MEEMQGFMACMVSSGFSCEGAQWHGLVLSARLAGEVLSLESLFPSQTKTGFDIDERCAVERRALLECATAAVSCFRAWAGCSGWRLQLADVLLTDLVL